MNVQNFKYIDIYLYFLVEDARNYLFFFVFFGKIDAFSRYICIAFLRKCARMEEKKDKFIYGKWGEIIALIYFVHHKYAIFLSKFGDWGRFVTGSNIKLSVKLLEIPCKMLL